MSFFLKLVRKHHAPNAETFNISASALFLTQQGRLEIKLA